MGIVLAALVAAGIGVKLFLSPVLHPYLELVNYLLAVAGFFVLWVQIHGMLTDFRKLLDAVADAAGWKPGEIRSKMFRHGYITARLQTLDRGAPVSPWTVAREVGHSSTDMIEEVYGISAKSVTGRMR